jgi:pyridoxal phosphate enzyme (YggS family)
MTMPSPGEIAERAALLRAGVDAAAQRAGRDPATVRILAVTKTWPVEVCRAALAAGLPMLGENRVQEAEAKIAALPDAEWHLVGGLQSNKVRRAVAGFDVIHSVDAEALLSRVERAAHDAGRRPRILLQVNTTAEPQKGGLSIAEALEPALVAALRGLRHAQPVGLMTIGRAGADPHEPFAALHRLRDELEQRAGMPLPELSMGMSGDWQAAVREGATLLRIGTALFGGRPG